MKQTILCLLILLCFVGVGSATNYYIDYESGSDSNDGLSDGAPWKHCPGDENAIGNAGSSTLSSGDTIYFKGGVEYVIGDSGTNCYIALSWSGSDGSPIVYDGNSNGLWGSGKSIISSNNDNNSGCGNRRGFYTNVARTYLVFDNFEFVDIGGYTTDPSATSCSPTSPGIVGRGIMIWGDNGGDIIIRNCYFHEIGTWEGKDPFNSGSITGTGIYLRDQDNVTINDCEFTKLSVGMGIYTQGGANTSNITINNNSIHNTIRWGIDIATQGTLANISDISIYNNEIYNYTEYDQGNWGGCGEFPHTDGIFVRSDFQNIVWDNIRIYNNSFYDTLSDGYGGTASVYVTEGPSVLIYNNIFHNVLHGQVISIGNQAPYNFSEQIVGIYNNAFYGKKNFIGVGGDEIKNATISIKNNIFNHTGYDANQTAPVYLTSTVSEDWEYAIDNMDYNIYYTPHSSDHCFKYGSSFYTFSEIQGCSAIGGCDIWETNGINDDPCLEGGDPYSFELMESSIAIDNGTDLSIYFNNDYDGVVRPINIEWDIGAYEYSSSFTVNHIKSYFNTTSQIQNVVNDTEYTIWNRTITILDSECNFNLEVTTI